MPEPRWMIYGATGYTGGLVAREALRRGMSPILAGRDQEALEKLGRDMGLEVRAVDLGESAGLRQVLEEVDAVLHCAGPFAHTSRPMVGACLDADTHYLDITGEIAVFEWIQRAAPRARAAGVALVPGVGFDVVPTDCLAARLARSLPDAARLELAFTSTGGGASRGTLKTMVEALPKAGAIRRDGRIVSVPLAFDAKEIEFSCGRRWAMTIPWGDVSTAFHSTGIQNIRVYSGQSPAAIRRARRLRPFLRPLGTAPVKRLVSWWIDRTVTGPNEEARDSARFYVWGRVENDQGERVTGTVELPDGYAFTAVAAVEATRRVLGGEVVPGSWTPSRAFGEDFAGELPGVVVGGLERGRRRG